MYTGEQKEKALAMYDATQSIAEVIRQLGYPSKQALYTWIANRDKPWQKPNGFRGGQHRGTSAASVGKFENFCN